MADVQPKFAVERLYIRDVSFETPEEAMPSNQGWQPKLHLDLNVHPKPLENNRHEVTLMLTVSVKVDDKQVFIIELQQSGIFRCEGFNGKQMEEIIHVHCPAVLFPYARETIDSLVVKGGFPPLMLSPVNFEHLYRQAKSKQSAAQTH